ncbi:YIP1 family protein [candidate division KSB1 bacterium]|nr:YIP1 family protein [candidate division KSB1 bacterium]
MTENNSQSNDPSAVKEMNLLNRIIGIFTSPGATFHAIAEKPKWVVPGIIIILLSLGTTFLLRDVILQEQRVKTEEQLLKRGIDSAQMETILDKNQQITKIAMYPGVLVTTAVMFVIVAAIWLFVSNIVLGGQATFNQMLGVSIYRGFIPLVGGLIKAPLMISQQTLNIHFSLATFMPDEAKETFLYKLLAQIELFNVWSIIVLCIGIAVVSKLNVKKVWPWVAIIYLLWFVGTSAVSGLLGR